MRTPAKALLVVMAAGVCAACTPRGVGATGVGVTGEGDPVGFLYVCDQSIDGVTLYTQESEAEAEAGSWAAPDPVRGGARWRLDSTPEWDDAAEPVTIAQDEVYVMYGWTDDNSVSTGAVSFTQDDLQDLRPGQVLWGEPGTVTSLEQFKVEACDSR